MPTIDLPILQNVEAISSCRDRDALGRILLQAAEVLLGENAEVAIFSRMLQGETVLKYFLGTTGLSPLVAPWPDLLAKVPGDGQAHTLADNGSLYGALPLFSSEIANDHQILVYAIDAANGGASLESLSCLARIYGNQVSLLDYSELDTLTHLLNRKTFDETFDRLLTARLANAAEVTAENRREHAEQGKPAWLGVIDIDHFKRVNDSFGHLFGDEVLLRVGDLMRKTFRGGDRLFRFGGEEFVVILNAENEALAATGFNRFRASVENNEFPQVGQVTCSLGFTAVLNGDVPTDVVGRADEALYYAKEHGRNQVCCYEELLAEGAIAPPVVVEAPVSDFDIDALFE
jgi:diguanylate cyclase (GGDEF)-like protein